MEYKKAGLGSFKEFVNETSKNCNDVNSIQDINNQYNYEDKKGLGLSGDSEWDLLSCGQDGKVSGYNELQRFYDEHIPEKYKGLALNKVVLKVLCECCKEIPHEKRIHEEFKKCVGEKLGIVIK